MWNLAQSTSTAGAILWLASAAGAFAQPAAEPEGILSGPKVEESEGGPKSFGEDAMSSRRQVPPIPFRAWRQAVLDLDLTSEQKASIEPIIAEHETAAAEFEAKHGEKASELRRQVREARQAGREPSIDLQKERQELRQLAPDAEAYQQRILAHLTPEQMQALDARVATMRQRLARDGERNQAPAGEAARNAAAAPDAPRPPARPMDEPLMAPTAPQPGTQLDEIGQRRLEFLQSRRSKSAPARDAPSSPAR